MRRCDSLASKAVSGGWIALLLASTAAFPAAAAGQPNRDLRRDGVPERPSAGDEDEARRRFFAGAQLFEEANYEGALAEFEASYRVLPQPVVLFNIAQTQRSLFRYDEAVENFGQYLREGADRIPMPRQRQVRQTIAELERRIAAIRLNVVPAGATVLIDGRSVGQSPLPLAIRMSAGRRVIEVEADGYLPLREEIEVIGRTPRTIDVRLARRNTAGSLAVTAAPADAALRIDGLEVGHAPVRRQLPQGGHVIEAVLPGYEVYRTAIQLAPQQHLDLHAVLVEDRGPGLTGQWWFWAGASALVVAAAVTTFFIIQASEPEPVPGNSFNRVIEVLRAP